MVTDLSEKYIFVGILVIDDDSDDVQEPPQQQRCPDNAG
jgi:hypothetical protein